MRRLIVTLATVVGLAALCLPSPVSASLVNAYFVEDLYASGIERTVDNGANWYTTTVGLFHWQRTGGDYPQFTVFDFYAFCIEPREFVSPGSTYQYEWNILENGTTNIGGMGAPLANQLRELYGRYYPAFTGALNSDTAGALQIATWEIVRETSGTLDVLNGTTRFRNGANPAALTLAQTYLSGLTGSGPSLDNIFALTAVDVQDIVVQDSPVPEPGTGALVGIGLLLLPCLLRRLKLSRSSRMWRRQGAA